MSTVPTTNGRTLRIITSTCCVFFLQMVSGYSSCVRCKIVNQCWLSRAVTLCVGCAHVTMTSVSSARAKSNRSLPTSCSNKSSPITSQLPLNRARPTTMLLMQVQGQQNACKKVIGSFVFTKLRDRFFTDPTSFIFIFSDIEGFSLAAM